MQAIQSAERYIDAFNERQTTEARSPVWLGALRQAAMASFTALGFPTTKNEDWKNTNIESLVSLPFVSSNGEVKSVRAAEILSNACVDADAPRLVFVNGVYAPELSSVHGLPSGVRVGSLAEFIQQDSSVLASRLGHYADHRRQAFVALNTAFFTDGAIVEIGPGCRLSQPIYIIYAANAEERRIVAYPRTLIMAGAGSEAKIVESYTSVNGGSYFSNAVTELIGEEGASVEHYRLQREGKSAFHVGTLEASLGRGCHLTAHAVTLSGLLVRNNVHVLLDGEGAGCILNGLYLGDDKQVVDNFTEIEHAKPRATSLELYKGILNGASHGVFNGKIIVHKDAQKSDARQTNKNLLLSAQAAVNTKPQLEIYADDVKCSHGSTIGQLDADALFYLRSRGLGLDEARSLLSFAFASDVVERIKIDFLRRCLDDYLVSKFRGV